MKVWVTKYALTDGIIHSDASKTSIDGLVKTGTGHLLHGDGREWHSTEESARAKAESMRIKKIASLKKQVEKLEKMRF